MEGRQKDALLRRANIKKNKKIIVYKSSCHSLVVSTAVCYWGGGVPGSYPGKGVVINF